MGDQAIEIAIRLSPQDPFRWAFYAYRSLAHIFGESLRTPFPGHKAVRTPNSQYWAQAHLVAALGHWVTRCR
jgi:hypothetical protein